MRLNKYIALHTSNSRRGADALVAENRVLVNGLPAKLGLEIKDGDIVTIDNKEIAAQDQPKITTLMINKPRGYVCSREGQSNRTIYELLPATFAHLNSVGRLDKDSSGLLLLTNDGELANRLAHPRYEKVKVYDIELDKPLLPLHQQMISGRGLDLEDGASRLQVDKLNDQAKQLRITMREGRNRQIRRTFEAVGYKVLTLHRIAFGEYKLDDLLEGKTKKI